MIGYTGHFTTLVNCSEKFDRISTLNIRVLTRSITDTAILNLGIDKQYRDGGENVGIMGGQLLIPLDGTEYFSSAWVFAMSGEPDS